MICRSIRVSAIALIAFVSLSGCMSVIDNMVLADMDPASRKLVETHRLGENFKNATDAQAVRTIQTARNPELVTLGGVIGIWEQRPALIDAALARGMNLNQGIPNRLLLSYPKEDLMAPGPLNAAYLIGTPPSMTQLIDERAVVSAAMLVRDLQTFDRLIQAGAVYNPATLNATLKTATVFGNTPILSERLLQMGAELSPELIFSVASQGSAEMLSWVLSQGIDPNSRLSTPGDRRQHTGLEGITLYSYAENITPLFSLPGYTPDTPSRQRAIDMARLLIQAGAEVNATATFSYSISEDQPISGWTPLHAYSMTQHQPYGNPDLVAYLISVGANTQALNSHGQTPAQVTGMVDRVTQQMMTLADQRKRQREQREAQARQQSQTADSGNLFGQAMAIAGLATVGAAASNAGVDSSAVMQIVGGGIADVMTEGRAGGIQQAQQQIQQQQQQQSRSQASNQTTAALPPAPGFQTETYRVSCPSGVSNDIPLHYRTQQCRSAMIDFAQAYSCNDYRRFEQVHAACERACGSVNCLQE